MTFIKYWTEQRHSNDKGAPLSQPLFRKSILGKLFSVVFVSVTALKAISTNFLSNLDIPKNFPANYKDTAAKKGSIFD